MRASRFSTARLRPSANSSSRPTSTISAISILPVNAGEKIEETLKEMAPDAEIHFERIAVTPAQIVEWSLPSRPTKTSDTRVAKFDSDFSVELDASEPHRLRALVQETIELHLPPDQFEILKAAEESERENISRLVGKIARKRLRSRRWRG